MSDNPYAPPTADVEAPGTGNSGGTGDFVIGQCLSDAWAAAWPNLPVFLGVGFVAIALLFLSALTVVGIFIVWPLLSYGGVRVMLNAHDGRAAFADLWVGFERPGARIIAGLGLMILFVGLSWLGQIPVLAGTFADSGGLLAAGYVINFIWTLVMLRFNFAWFLWVERESGPIDSLSESWSMTSLVKWKLIGLYLVAIAIVLVPMLVLVAVMIPAAATESAGVMIVGGLAFVIMIIPASILGSLIYVSAYRQMVGRPEVAR
jgi:hypothetical protein